MPKKFRIFEVMKETSSRARLQESAALIRQAIGENPPQFFHADRQVALLDLLAAAPIDVLHPFYKSFLMMTAVSLSNVRLGHGGKWEIRFLGQSLRMMGLTPGIEPSPAAILEAYNGKGRVN